MIRQRGFTVDADFLKHRFILTNGHPGLVHGFLVGSLSGKVSGPGARLFWELVFVVWPGCLRCDLGRRISDAQACTQAIR